MTKLRQSDIDEALELSLYSVDLWQFSWEELDLIENWIDAVETGEYFPKEVK